jgi:tryptophan synthase alpha chain
MDRLPEAAAQAGVSGFIVPDLPVDESDLLKDALAAKGIAVVQMVTPVTTPERLTQVVAASTGFVYAVTMTGVTGKSVAVPAEVMQYLDRVRAQSRVPVCAGFGIRSREQVRLAGAAAQLARSPGSPRAGDYPASALAAAAWAACAAAVCGVIMRIARHLPHL